MNVPHMSPGVFQGCRRGVFGLKSWEPLHQPSAAAFDPLPELRALKTGSDSGSTPGSVTGAKKQPGALNIEHNAATPGINGSLASRNSILPNSNLGIGNGGQNAAGGAGHTQNVHLTADASHNSSGGVRSVQNTLGAFDGHAPGQSYAGDGMAGSRFQAGGGNAIHVAAEKPFEAETRRGGAEVGHAIPQPVAAVVRANLASGAAATTNIPAPVDWLDEPEEVMMKYSYKANPESPLGVELSVTQREMVMRLGVQPDLKLWTYVQNSQGMRGYVPSNYITVIEKQVTSLPWLQNSATTVDLPPVSTEPYKPYKSAYVKDPAPGTVPAAAATKWYCEVCAKSFNGPQPYNAHMVSRAHKDELTAQA